MNKIEELKRSDYTPEDLITAGFLKILEDFERGNFEHWDSMELSMLSKDMVVMQMNPNSREMDGIIKILFKKYSAC